MLFSLFTLVKISKISYMPSKSLCKTIYAFTLSEHISLWLYSLREAFIKDLRNNAVYPHADFIDGTNSTISE
nr:MAG TPA: hypothetical protein [Caudoviricetes sp.]